MKGAETLVGNPSSWVSRSCESEPRSPSQKAEITANAKEGSVALSEPIKMATLGSRWQLHGMSTVNWKAYLLLACSYTHITPQSHPPHIHTHTKQVESGWPLEHI